MGGLTAHSHTAREQQALLAEPESSDSCFYCCCVDGPAVGSHYWKACGVTVCLYWLHAEGRGDRIGCGTVGRGQG